jgi:hypothetical protein
VTWLIAQEDFIREKRFMEMENTQKGKIILYDSYFMTVVTYKAET